MRSDGCLYRNVLFERILSSLKNDLNTQSKKWIKLKIKHMFDCNINAFYDKCDSTVS